MSDGLTISELIESLETAKFESGGDPETPFEGVYWDGAQVVFIQPSECVCDVQGSELSASCKVHAVVYGVSKAGL